MISLKEALHKAEEKKVALGHFNIANIEMFWAVVRAAKNLDVPVIIGVSEGERAFIGIQQVKALVDTVRAEGLQVYLNADHTYKPELVKEAVDSKAFDSIIFDGAKLSYEENRDMTKEMVQYARDAGSDSLIEAELGFIGAGSTLLDALPEGAEVTEEFMTKPDEAKQFVEETDVDLLAPAVGNIHGMLKGASNPHISPERVKAVREAGGVPLVLHGGSGIVDEDFRKGIEAGISTVHISTEMRIAYRTELENQLKEQPDQLAPYRIMPPVVDAVQSVVEKRLKLFNHII